MRIPAILPLVVINAGNKQLVDYDISPLEAVFYFILKLENGEIS
jgi:hypothetical protein